MPDAPFASNLAQRFAWLLVGALAVSATYELIEWAAAVIMGQGADEFLGTQGDPSTPNRTCSLP
jgi:uncharacterized membrane protein YjdF